MSDGLEGRVLKVVVVDDDEVDREAVRRALRDVSVEVHEAASGPDALAMLAGDVTTPRLLLLDINMPVMDGFALLDAIRADQALADTVVFVLTSSAREADMAEAYSRHVAGYLVKGDLGPRMSHLSSLLAAYSASVHWPS